MVNWAVTARRATRNFLKSLAGGCLASSLRERTKNGSSGKEDGAGEGRWCQVGSIRVDMT
jgi:hypothetical protein